MRSQGLRVLQVIPGLGASTGGPAQAVVGLSRALQRQGQHVAVYTTDLPGPATGWHAPHHGDPDLFGTVHDLRVEGIDIRAFPVLWPPRYAYAPQLGRVLRREVNRFDIVHLHSLFLYPVWAAARACQQAEVPYILRPHGILTAYQGQQHTGIKVLYDRFLGKNVLTGAALLHYTSLNESREAQAYGLSQPGRVVRLGIDAEMFSPLPEYGIFRARHPAIGSRPLLLFLSRLAPKKGLDLLLPAFAAVLQDCPEAHLVLAGPDTDGYGTHIHTLVHGLGLSNSVTFTGMLVGGAKLAALRDADVWVLPSYAENFGIAVVEAMAAGLPVVVSDQVDIHLEIEAASAGIVVPCSIEPLALALLHLLNDPGERRRRGAQGRELALKRFSWDSVAQEVLTMYEEVLRG